MDIEPMTQDDLLRVIEEGLRARVKELDVLGNNLTELLGEIGQLSQLEVFILGKWSK